MVPQHTAKSLFQRYLDIFSPLSIYKLHCTVMLRRVVLWSMTDYIYDGGPIDYNRVEKFLSPTEAIIL